jgi:Down syndrome cell adhesion molecule
MDTQSGWWRFISRGSLFKVQCFFSKVQWARSPNSIFERRYRRSYPEEDEGWLILDNVQSSHNGAVYTCTVSSPSGEMAKRGVEIKVMEPPILDSLSFGSDVKEGEIAKVVCSVKSGDTPVFFSWLKDGTSIPTGLKVN